jgi:hypothetical protein
MENERTVAEGKHATFLVALNTTPCTPSRTRRPTAGAALAATHGVEPGSAVNAATTPHRDPNPALRHE